MNIVALAIETGKPTATDVRNVEEIQSTTDGTIAVDPEVENYVSFDQLTRSK